MRCLPHRPDRQIVRQTFGFFDQNLVMEYSRLRAVAEGVNVQGRAIGRMKMCARAGRGYKTWKGMQTGPLLAGAYWF